MLRFLLTGMLAVIAAGCAKSSPTLPIFERVQLSDAEKRGLRQSLYLNPDYPTFVAVSHRDSAVRYFCLQYFSLGTTLSQYQVAILSEDGTLIEETLVHIPNSVVPTQLLGVSPLRIKFRDPDVASREYVGQAFGKEKFSMMVREAQRIKDQVFDSTNGACVPADFRRSRQSKANQ